MKTSENGSRFIRQNEGFRAQVYNDNGKPCIGYGHDLSSIEIASGIYTKGIDESQACQLQIEDINKLEPLISKQAPQANQNQFDALVDFAYNLGLVPFFTMMHHGWDQITTQIPAWHYKHVKGEVVEDSGLKARRLKEVTLFNTPISGV